MKVKKNPNFDVSRNSSLYFAIGLCLMLFASYNVLNHKTYESDSFILELIDVELDLDDDIPITEQINIPPPPMTPPPAVVEVITIVEDMEEVEESIIESTETSQEEVIAEQEVFVEDVVVEEVEEVVEVPFAIVEVVPTWPGCKGNTNQELKKCFQDNIQKHIANKFSYPEVALELGIHGKVFVMFVVDNKGLITSVKSRGPDKLLEAEAERIINTLPVMIPGQQRGKKVNVPYSIPIVFKLDNH